MKLYCATTNAGKLREFQSESQGLEVLPLPGLAGLAPCEETGASFEENAVQKALYYSAYTDGYLFVDDSGLMVDSLAGAPGIYSARFAGPNATDEENNQRLLQKLRGTSERTARFVCVIALALKGRVIRTFAAEVEGRIMDAPRGAGGFGYDPLFYYEDFGCSLAEVSASQKKEVSHRGKALRAMFAYLAELSPKQPQES